jgi:hypothetical protein
MNGHRLADEYLEGKDLPEREVAAIRYFADWMDSPPVETEGGWYVEELAGSQWRRHALAHIWETRADARLQLDDLMHKHQTTTFRLVQRMNGYGARRMKHQRGDGVVYLMLLIIIVFTLVAGFLPSHPEKLKPPAKTECIPPTPPLPASEQGVGTRT